MASLVVEPFASLVDTAFVERLGAASAAGLGAATALLSGILWIFNFLAWAPKPRWHRPLAQEKLTGSAAWPAWACCSPFFWGWV